MIDDEKPSGWDDWYRFAVEVLDCEHDEAVEYANLRTIEDLNHESLRRRGSSGSAGGGTRA